jgi:hypothetical protein
MRNGQIEKMSLKELLALDAKIKAAIDEKRSSERHELKAKLEDLARASGFNAAELFGGRRGKAVRRPPNTVTPKTHHRPGLAAAVVPLG